MSQLSKHTNSMFLPIRVHASTTKGTYGLFDFSARIKTNDDLKKIPVFFPELGGAFQSVSMMCVLQKYFKTGPAERRKNTHFQEHTSEMGDEGEKTSQWRLPVLSTYIVVCIAKYISLFHSGQPSIHRE